jgi:hypothetical protein
MSNQAEGAAALRARPPIRISGTYTFRSTQISGGYGERDGQSATVLSGPAEKDEPDQESLYTVRFGDGFEGQAFEGELDGYYEQTGQTVADRREGA